MHICPQLFQYALHLAINPGKSSADTRTVPVFDGPDDREWAGEMFRGASTTEDDYVRAEPIQDSIAYTLHGDE
jgi:hypothetical protein